MTSHSRLIPLFESRRAAASSALVLLLMFSTAACGSQIAGTGSPAQIAPTSLTSTAGDPTTDVEPPPSSKPPQASIPVQKHVDACALLNHAEANTLADMELQDGIGAGEEKGVNTLCQYTRDPYKSGNGQVTIIVGDGAKKSLDIDKDTLGHPFKKVAGIGDEAWQEENAIFVRKGTTWVNIGLVLLNDPAVNVVPLQQAAKIVVGRL